MGWRSALGGESEGPQLTAPEVCEEKEFSSRKTCGACGESKHVTYFYAARGGDGRSSRCKSCVKTKRKSERTPLKTDHSGRKYKHCSRCSKVGRRGYHHVSLFPTNKDAEGGYHRWCFKCCDEADRLWRMEKHVRKRVVENCARLDQRIKEEISKGRRRKNPK